MIRKCSVVAWKTPVFSIKTCFKRGIHDSNIHRVCIVGSGPSAFYCAKYILENPTLTNIHVDMIEKLPVPYGAYSNASDVSM